MHENSWVNSDPVFRVHHDEVTLLTSSSTDFCLIKPIYQWETGWSISYFGHTTFATQCKKKWQWSCYISSLRLTTVTAGTDRHGTCMSHRSSLMQLSTLYLGMEHFQWGCSHGEEIQLKLLNSGCDRVWKTWDSTITQLPNWCKLAASLLQTKTSSSKQQGEAKSKHKETSKLSNGFIKWTNWLVQGVKVHQKTAPSIIFSYSRAQTS